VAHFGTSCFELPWATLPVQRTLGYPLMVISGVPASIPTLCYFPRGVLHRGWPSCSSLEQPRGTPLFRKWSSGQDPCLSFGHVTVAAPALNTPSASHFPGNCRRNQVSKTLVVRHHPGAMTIGLKAPPQNFIGPSSLFKSTSCVSPRYRQ
jgi:hypothetical protein